MIAMREKASKFCLDPAKNSSVLYARDVIPNRQQAARQQRQIPLLANMGSSCLQFVQDNSIQPLACLYHPTRRRAGHERDNELKALFLRVLQGPRPGYLAIEAR
jgi:hypothetical protein